MTRIRHALSIVSLFLTFSFNIQAQNLPGDLQPITPEQIPLNASGGVFSMAHYPDWPPMPGLLSITTGEQLYFSPSLNSVFYDDRATVMAQMLTAEQSGPPAPGDGGDTNAAPMISYYSPQYDLSTNFVDLWLEIPYASNGIAHVLLHNTTNTILYNLIGNPALADGTSCSNWISEAVVWGMPETNITAVDVAMGDRTNLFFWAYSITNGTVTV